MNSTVLSRRALAGVALVALALAGCGKTEDPKTNPSGAELTGTLKASGASFPDPFYQKVIDAFVAKNGDADVTYNPVGSGAGKKEFGQGLTDFAGTDSSVKDTDGIAAGSFLYIPTVAAPITVSYNLKGVDKLQLSADTIAKIFQREIKKWDDPAIAADNPGVKLPATAITVAHRSDASGTTSNFTKYLDSAAKGTWKLGASDTVAWPADTQGGAKNTGVAQLVKQSDGGIGYIDLADAKQSGVSFAAIKNKDGKYVAPTLDATTAALAGAEIKDDLTYNPLNAAGADTYPITAPTYLLVKTKYTDAAKLALVKAYVKFVLNEGQAMANANNFAPLPEALKTKALAQLDKVS